MKRVLIFTAILGVAVTAAYGQDVTKAMVRLDPKSGSKVTGTITFTKSGDDVEVTGDIENLKPGKHGLHIHEKGDCSAADAASAGGHFNPTHKHHDGPVGPDRHVGDFGNIEADSSGKGHLVWKGKL